MFIRSVSNVKDGVIRGMAKNGLKSSTSTVSMRATSASTTIFSNASQHHGLLHHGSLSQHQRQLFMSSAAVKSANGGENSSSSSSSPNEPKYESDPEIVKKIRALIESNKVCLFMKGTPDDPECGFSANMIQILDNEDYDAYTFVDVLKSDKVRESVKEVSDWPTVPQLFIKGEFIGGCDIVTEMHKEGELKKLIDKVKEEEQGEGNSSEKED